MASVFTRTQEMWNKLSTSGRVMTVGGILSAVGLVVAVVYFGSQPDYQVLFKDLKPTDAQVIVEKLKTGNVPYTVSNNGTTIMVPSDRISELRLQMAGEGAITGGHVGFDLFDKTNFGATDFAQQVNYRRAIEGELAKTLEGMDEIESARVHVTPKKESVFSEKEAGAKASVMLRVRQNKELSSERAASIVSLVASSIEGLEPSEISVMDTRGRLLVAASRNGNGQAGNAGGFPAQLQVKQKFEAENAARIVALLEPIVGENRVRADVAADFDFNQVEQSEEKYDPQSQVVRSQQTSQEARNASALTPSGVVGARSNNPTKPASPAATTATAATGDQRNMSTVNYEIDKTVKKTVSSGGRVSKMSVSVVVDHKMVNGVEVARTAEEIKQIQDLVTGAVGLDTNRGDSVTVQSMLFDKSQMEEAAPASFLDRNKQLVPNLVKYGALALVAVLLLLFVIRPAHRALKAASTAALEERKLLAGEQELNERRRAESGKPKQLLENAMRDSAPMMTVAELEAQMGADGDPALNKHVERVENIRKQIAAQSLSDTETVVSTLRGWIRENA